MSLEDISQVAEPVNNMRAASTSGFSIPHRPESLKLRNCSRSRDVESGEGQAEPQNIQIAASPSIFRPATTTQVVHGFYRRLSRANPHERRNSFTDVNSQSSQARGLKTSADPNTPDNASRAASRGRQLGHHASPASHAQRATSQDSTHNRKLHVRNSRRENNERTDGQLSRSRRRSPNQHPDLSHFQRVETVACPSCPVHGRRSASSSSIARSIRSPTDTHQPQTGKE